MAKKYDTNPLDPDFPKKAGHAQQTETLPNLDAETKSFSGAPVTEDPTRRYDNANFAQYSSVYADQPQGAMYQTTRLAEPENPGNRKIVGLPENVLTVLPYAPFYIGLVAGILELLFVPQSETRVRFHAAQGLAMHIAILAVTLMLGFIGNFSRWATYGSRILAFLAFIFLIVTMVRVWRGKAVHIEALDSLTNWLSEKVKFQPKK